MSKQKVKAKGTVEMEEVISYLEELLNSMKSGRVTLERGGDQIALTTGSAAELEIEAEQEEGKQELSFELKWKEGLESGRKFDLKISSEEAGISGTGSKSAESRLTEEEADVHPEEELRHYRGTEAFGGEFEEYTPTV